MSKKRSNMANEDLSEMLSVAYGQKRAKKIVKEIQRFKAKNPKKVFSFIFAEDGSFKAIEKSKDKDIEENV
jgi:hypothetical protein